jgi:hypothetical protein
MAACGRWATTFTVNSVMGTNWVVTTVAGLGATKGSTDGVGNVARFYGPTDIRFDSFGHLLIGDRNNSTVREGVIYDGRPTVTFPPQSLVSYAGTNVIFCVNVMSTTPSTYQWQFNGTNLVDDSNISGSQSNVLTISSVLLTNIGNYQLIVSNDYGCITSIVATQSIILPPMKPVLTPAGNQIGFSWTANSNLTYQLQYTTNLSQPDWINFGTPFSTNGTTAFFNDSVESDPQRFYRVQLVP